MSAEDHYKCGAEHITKGNYSKAVEDFTEAIRLNSNVPKYHFNRGFALLNLERSHEALNAFDQAILLNPDNAHNHFVQGYTLFGLKRYQEALAAYDKAVDLNVNDDRYHLERGNTLYYLERYQEALAAYDKVIELNPSNTHYYTGQGNVLIDLGRFQEALATFDQAIVLNANDATYHSSRGSALSYLERYQEALAAYNNAIELDPGNARYYNGQGNALINLRRFQEAVAAFDQAIILNPGNGVYHYGQGNALFSLKYHLEALVAFDKAVYLDANDAGFHYGRGNALYDLKRYQEALVAYDKAVKLNPNNALYQYGYGTALRSLKRYPEALVAYNNAIVLNDTLSLSYYNQAYIYDELIDYATAQANYVRYIFLGNVDPRNYSTLLTFFRDHGDAPFVVKRLLGINLSYYHVSRYQTFIDRVDAQCRPVQDCLDWAAMQEWPNQHPARFLRFEALCHYFMGDTAESYFIFDSLIDGKYSLSLIDHYYYIQSALHSARPEFSLNYVLKEARVTARAVGNDPKTTLIQWYYAGLILYNFKENSHDAVLAGQFFDQAKGLLAAKYMRWLIASPQDRFARQQEILSHETRLPLGKSFAQGLVPRVIGRAFTDYDENIQHYCFYHELTEAIQGVHGVDAPLGTVAFYEYWQFVLSSEKNNVHEQLSEEDLLTQFRNTREAEKAYAQLGRLLTSMQTFLSIEKIEENIRGQLGDLFLELMDLKDQAHRDTLTQRPGGIEDLLASKIWRTAKFKTYEQWNIKGIYYWEVHQQFILYFFARGQLNVRQAIQLIMYAGYATAEENLFNLVRQASSLDGSSDLLKAVPEIEQVRQILAEFKESEKMQEVGKVIAGAIGTAMIPIGSTLGSAFLLGFMVKSLLSIIEEKFIHSKEKMGYREDYANFLKELDTKVAAARREGNLDPFLEKILGLA